MIKKLIFVALIVTFTIATQHETCLDFLINSSHGTGIERRAVPYLLGLIASILVLKK